MTVTIWLLRKPRKRKKQRKKKSTGENLNSKIDLSQNY